MLVSAHIFCMVFNDKGFVMVNWKIIILYIYIYIRYYIYITKTILQYDYMTRTTYCNYCNFMYIVFMYMLFIAMLCILAYQNIRCSFKLKRYSTFNKDSLSFRLVCCCHIFQPGIFYNIIKREPPSCITSVTLCHIQNEQQLVSYFNQQCSYVMRLNTNY